MAMKIRVTIMTENDKHLPDVPDEKLEAISKGAWQMLLHIVNIDPADKAIVEKIEIVER